MHRIDSVEADEALTYHFFTYALRLLQCCLVLAQKVEYDEYLRPDLLRPSTRLERAKWSGRMVVPTRVWWNL